MEQVFKAKRWKTWEQVLLIMCIIVCALLVWHTKNYFLIISFIPLFIGYNQYFSKYVVKENGDLWVNGMWNIPLYKGVGIYRVLYYPERKGWYNINRRIVIFYKSGLKQGSFPVNPAHPEELIAVLQQRNPGLKVDCFSTPVNE